MGVFENTKITSLVELEKILLLIAQKEQEGKISQILNNSDLFCTKVSIGKILYENKYPDFIRYYFEDLEYHTKYLLSVETYHGIGGELKIISE